MPSPKSGNAPSAVSPAAPKDAVEADKANPGEVTKAKGAGGQSGASGGGAGGGGGAGAAKPHNPTEEDKKTKKSWIEIVLVDMENHPVPGEPYKITLPDNSVAEGTLDEKGFARVEAFDAGNCKITFPNRDQSVWSPK